MYTNKQKLIIMLEGAMTGVYAAITIMDTIRYLHRSTPTIYHWREPDVTGVTRNQEDEDE